MMKILMGIWLVLSLALPASAEELIPPEVPPMGQERMPQNTDSFPDALMELLENSAGLIRPELEGALQISCWILFAALLTSILPVLSEKNHSAVSIAATAAISAVMFQHTGAMVGYASETVWELCEYGKLLCPVLTTALAAQGGVTVSAALYAGTTAFLALLGMLVSRLIVPMVYLFLAFSVAYSALNQEMLKKFSDAVKNLLTWLLKTLLVVFTTYMSLTGAVSGTTDTAALKAARITISSTVPVVGGILSDASESVLVGVGVLKNAAGIYGILAVLAVLAEPFVKIGMQYLFLKASSAVCSLFADKSVCTLTEHFSAAMGLLLDMVATGGMLVFISTVCYLKGIG